MKKYVVFMRGINVGGNKKVPMNQLKDVLTRNGYHNVKTLLASGNVVFESEEERIRLVQSIIEEAFGFSIPTIVFPFDYIKAIVENQPFKDVETASTIKCNVTFSQAELKTSLSIPFQNEDGSFRILQVTDHSVFWMSDTSKIKTTEVMKLLDREFGKEITTRNYNTVVKLAKLAS
ncbi:DUF1697 domain-containing protein [Sunxiuqinia indica]|uniref:DUF1697 domain-containing protein n=1 Tax=Sunxiuqinia indica TaxID=2692584 RepID=UPI00135C1398|nr:DUF1697 domain-containing protein [Sunxiuqinia indica]